MKDPGTKYDTKRNKILALVFGLIIMLCIGILYMWSVFQPYVISEYGWDAGDVGMTSAIMISMFVVGNIISGLIQEKMPTRMISYIGCVMFTFGMYLTSLLRDGGEPWMVYLTYGVVSGLGSGIAYSTVLSVLQKWFVAKSGLITGITVGAFGLSVLVMTPVAESLLTKTNVAATFCILAIAFIIICYISSFFIIKPSSEYYMREASKVMKPDSLRQYSPKEMVKTPMFYLLLVSMSTSTAAYLVIVPYIRTIASDRGIAESLSLVAVMLTGVANAGGRILAPAVSDKIGRTTAVIICGVIGALACVGMIFAEGIIYVCMVFLLAFTYGGAAGVHPVISTQLFGARNSGTNYGLVLTGLAVSSIVFGKIAAVVGAGASGAGFNVVFGICAVVSLLPVVMMFILKLTCKKREISI